MSFETLKKPKDVGVFVEAWREGVEKVKREVGGLIAKATQMQQRKFYLESLYLTRILCYKDWNCVEDVFMKQI